MIAPINPTQYANHLERRHINVRWHVMAIVCIALLELAIFEGSSVDLIVAYWFYDPQINAFPLKNNVVFESIFHDGLKKVALVLGLIGVFWAIRQYRASKDLSYKVAYMVAIIAPFLIPIVVAILKDVTNRHCPWSMMPFGGSVPFTSLLEPLDLAYGREQCFPAGHASGGFAWISWGIAFWYTRPLLARYALVVAVILGGLMGGSQMMRGAHFLSHTLWTILVAWFITVILIAIGQYVYKSYEPPVSSS